MINQRLFDQYGINTKKDLGITKLCPRPFDTILIDNQGSCYVCECQAWLPQSIGNLQIGELSEIIGSSMHKHLQDSILDGSYRYCNTDQCSYIKADRVIDRKEKNIKTLRLAIDQSCNLRCPSCRPEMIFHKSGTAFEKGIRLANKIIKWLGGYNHSIKVHIGSDGDPFASHIYRHFMTSVPTKTNIRYSLLTNGLMFEEFHDKVPHIISNLEELGVSIDGATKQTYEKLRLGGKWKKICSNMECLSNVRNRHNFLWSWHMVVQADNWREMPMMLTMARNYGADRVYFNRIQDWNTGLNFERQDFYKSEEFKAMVKEIDSDSISRTWSLL